MCPVFVPNYLHLLNALAKSRTLNYSTFIHIFAFSCCVFLFRRCRKPVFECVRVCVWMRHWIYVSLSAYPLKCVYTRFTVVFYTLCPTSHVTNFQEYRHLLCISRFIQVQNTILLIRWKCRTHKMFKANAHPIVMITTAQRWKAHTNHSFARESNKI